MTWYVLKSVFNDPIFVANQTFFYFEEVKFDLFFSLPLRKLISPLQIPLVLINDHTIKKLNKLICKIDQDHIMVFDILSIKPCPMMN